MFAFNRYYNNEKNKQLSQTIVITEDIDSVEYNKTDSPDLIGDFILHHEYFTADAEVLKEEPEDDMQIQTEFIEEELLITDLIQDDVPEIKEDSQPEEQAPVQEVVAAEEEIDENKIPLIAVVIDDMGINQKRTLDIISIQAPLTSSFLTYGKNLKSLAEQAKQSGHEIMIHAPMEPKVDASLAPDTLKTDMSKEEIEEMFLAMLGKFENVDVKGINNHMGSKFTEDKERLGYIIDILKTQNMFFLDSKTTSVSKGKELTDEKNVAFASRDIFLDNENNYEYIFLQLTKAEKIAEKKGFAIAICHPKSNTYPALKDWVETLKDKNIKLVHISEIIKELN